MSDLVTLVRAIVRDELTRHASPQVGVVTAVFAAESSSGDANHEVHVKLGSGLELQHVPVTVGRPGLSMLPKVDDSVLVVFAGGDLNAPLVVGALYDATVRPPEAKAAELVYMPPDPEESGIRRIHLELTNGSLITLDDDKLTVQLGGTELVLNKDGDVSVKSAGKFELKADGDVLIEASGNIELKAQGQAKVSASSSLELSGAASAKLKGPALTLAGNTQFSPS